MSKNRYMLRNLLTDSKLFQFQLKLTGNPNFESTKI